MGRWLVIAGLALAGSWIGSPLALGAGGSSSGPSASATATIPVVFKSVTISTAKLTYANCTGGYSTGGSLGFPNAHCTTGQVTVTNGAAPSTILVTGSDAVPNDNGKGWALCAGPGAPTCTPNAPGVDQFSETDSALQLGLTGTCDANFAPSPCGSAVAHQASSESFVLYGPKSSTDQSPTFTTVITWTAS